MAGAGPGGEDSANVAAVSLNSFFGWDNGDPAVGASGGVYRADAAEAASR